MNTTTTHRRQTNLYVITAHSPRATGKQLTELVARMTNSIGTGIISGSWISSSDETANVSIRLPSDDVQAVEYAQMIAGDKMVGTVSIHTGLGVHKRTVQAVR